MKKIFLVPILLFSFNVLAQTQHCLDFGQYTTAGLQTTVNNSQTGDVIAQQGDIALIYGDVPLLWIDNLNASTNELAYNSAGNLGGITIDVSASNFNCKKLTFTSFLQDLIIDGDTLNIPFNSPFSNQNSNYSVNTNGTDIEITGNFNLVTPYSQTNIISNICLEDCAVPSNCFDFGQYTTASLQTTVNNSQIGDVIAQQGDIALIYGDVPLLWIDNLNASTNELAYNSGGYLGGIIIDVSASNYNCKKLTFTSFLQDLIVDGDTLNIPFNTPFSYQNNNYSVNTNGTDIEITGVFNLITPYSQTNIISNICLEDCSNSGINKENSNKYDIVLFPNPVVGGELFIKGDYTKVTSYLIYNIMGELVITQQLNSNVITINDLPKGQYIIQFLNKDNKFYTQKFIIE